MHILADIAEHSVRGMDAFFFRWEQASKETQGDLAMNIRHPFGGLSESAQKRSFISLLVITLAVMMGLNVIGRTLITAAAPQGIVSFEFAGTVEAARRMMDSWGETGRIAAGVSLGLDYLFLVAYSCCIALGCVLTARSLFYRVTFLASIGFVFAWAQFLAALLDAVENFALIEVLLGSNQEIWPALARLCAAPKFLIVLAGLFYVICGIILIFIVKDRRSTREGN